MSIPESESVHGGMNLADVIFALCKHKKKIIGMALAGIAAAVACLLLVPPVYESSAKILVRYVVDRSAIDGAELARNESSNKPYENAINSEAEILNSWDLFKDVAAQIGAERIVPKESGPGTIDDAASKVGSGIKTVVVPKTNVILIANKNSDPKLATEILDTLLKSYFNKHLDIHRSKEAFKVVSEQTDMFRTELAIATAKLKAKKAEASVISLKDASDSLNVELEATEREANAGQTALVQQRALVADLRKRLGGDETGHGNQSEHQKSQSPVTPQTDGTAGTSVAQAGIAAIPSDQIERYKVLVSQVASLEKKSADLRMTYTDEARVVKANEAELAALQRERQALVKKYPDIVSSQGDKESPRGMDLIAESAKLAALEAGAVTLEARLQNVRERAKKFAEVAPEIEDLERHRALQQTNYASSSVKLENARIDEALDPSKIPNISVVQRPSPALLRFGVREKAAVGLAMGGLILAVGGALFIELAMNQNIKRPVELERGLDIPVLLSIPLLGNGTAKRLKASNSEANGSARLPAKANGHTELAPWDGAHAIRPYSELIRDRLGLYFDVNGLIHKPKLIAVAGSRSGAGASTLAGGLAAAFSANGDSKVLLVDMNVGRAELQPFFKGTPSCSLDSAIHGESCRAPAGNNLFLATAGSARNGQPSIGLKRFYDMMPDIQASDFDFVIFDLPPLGEMNATAEMARFVDKFLYVVEADKSHRGLVKRAYSEIEERGRKKISVVLNKTQSFGSKWAEQAW